jgi:ABC-type dipeptide/oligopeptide/nickel transport system permease subunit
MKIRYRVFLKNKAAVAGLFLTVLISLVAVFAPLIAPYDVREQDFQNRYMRPSWSHPLGTDDFGRDTLSRVIYGARVSLSVGVLSVLISTVAGMLVGMFSGYLGGKFDALVVGLVDILMAFPTILLCLTILVVMGPGFWTLILSIGFSLFPRFIRIARGATLSVKQEKYVEAARLIGRRDAGILFLHVMPNISGPIIVIGSLWIATAIRIEAALSFLGFGVKPPMPTWGNMINAGMTFLTIDPWLVTVPGFAIMVTVIAFNMLGDGLRDISDPRLRQ